jgi:O-acetyl-ADP-ribose deacetylase
MTNIKVQQGDITQYNGDCIVNAANRSLCGGGGVDGGIHRAAGAKLLEECRKIGGCKTGGVKITNAYNIGVKRIIHAVGPVWSGGNRDEDKLLESCYVGALELCKKEKLRSIAFPNISCGVYRFPKERACDLSLRAVKEWIKDNPDILDEVVFMCFEPEIFGYMERIV